MTQVASIYCRISADKTGEGLGVERQEAECRTLCERLGFEVGEVFVDNDISATSGKTRPAFERLLKSNPQVVVTWHTDRLARLTKDLERLISLDVPVHAVTAGHLDLSTPSGRAVARTVTAWATFETEQKSLRQVAAARQKAEKGRPAWGGTRVVGFERDGAHIGREAVAIRAGYSALLEGASLASVGRDFDAAGVRPARAASWSLPALKKVFLAPRNAGLRTYRGEVIGKGNWSPIVSEEVFRGVEAILTDPARKTNPGTSRRQHLGSGLYLCPKCGARLFSNWQKDRRTGTNRRAYRCQPSGHLQRLAVPLDRQAAILATRVLVLPGAREAFTENTERPDADALRAERATLTARRDVELPQALAAGLSVAQVVEASRTLNERIDAINALLVSETSADVFGDWWTDGPDEGIDAEVTHFEGLPLHKRTAILTTLFDKITVSAERGGGLDVEPSATTRRILEDLGERLDNLARLAVEHVTAPADPAQVEALARAATERLKRRP